MVLEVSGAPHDYSLMILSSQLADPAGNRITTALGLDEAQESFDLALEYSGDVDYFGPYIGEADLCFGFAEPFTGGVQAELIDAEGQRLAVVSNTNDDRITEQSIVFGFHYIRVSWAAQQPGSYPVDYRLYANMLGCQ